LVANQSGVTALWVQIPYSPPLKGVNMLSIVKENFRDEDGNWENDGLLCHICGFISEAYMSYQINAYNKVYVCKGCLSKGIESINNHYQAHMKGK
jgi:hypothetical protein